MSKGSNGGTCTAEEWALSGASGVYCLTRQDKVGMGVVASAGFASLSAALIIFALIVRNVIYNRRSAVAVPTTKNESSEAGGEPPGANSSSRLIEQPMDLFMLSLFLGSFLQALGVILEVKWINDGKVYAGSFCTAQVFQNLGQSAVAIQTTIITVYTFATIWWGVKLENSKTAWFLVGTMWLFLVVFIAASVSVHKTPPFYYPTPFWCWIHNHYLDYRIAGESIWLWFAFAVAVTLYTPLCFYNVGYISPDGWTFKINSREEAPEGLGLPKFTLLICAMAYCAPVLPTALTRFFLIVHNDAKPFASAEAQFTVKTIFGLSGVCDVVVFLLARPNNLLFDKYLGPRKPFNIPARVRIGAWVAVWIALNAFDVVWIYHLYFYAFLLGLVNCAIIVRYIRTVWNFLTFTSLPMLLGIILGCFLRLLIIGLAITISLGPFFSPFLGLKLSQRAAWNRGCDFTQVILHGRPYYASTKENPAVASFNYFGQPGREYKMAQDENDTKIWHFRLSDVAIPPDLDPQVLSYRFANNSVSGTCATNTSSSAVTIPCMEGSFSDGGSALSLTVNDMRTGIVTKLRAVDKGVWAPVPADDAPSVLLREVRPDDSLGSVDMLRTVVTSEGDCTKLKLCLREKRIDLLAAVGLILKAQDSYAYLCTTPNN